VRQVQRKFYCHRPARAREQHSLCRGLRGPRWVPQKWTQRTIPGGDACSGGADASEVAATGLELPPVAS
jgi:hypothetical protein